MSTVAEQVSQEYLRIQANRNTIRTKLVELNLAASNATLDALATAIDEIVNRGTVNATVREGETYTIEPGFYTGGSVGGVSGGGNYALQEKTVTPTKKAATITSDAGYYGLSQVVVNPIPVNYQDVSDVTTTAPDVLLGKVFVMSDGSVKAGTMPNNGTISKTLDANAVSFSLAVGYYAGGTISIALEERNVTPTKEEQVITPATGKVLSKVTVAAIPKKYQDVSGVTAEDRYVLVGQKFVDATGALKDGTMPHYVDKTEILDTKNKWYHVAPGYHEGGSVEVVTEEKVATPAEAWFEVTPSDGKVLSKVIVDGIPQKYKDITPVKLSPEKVLEGNTYVDSTGPVEGTMPNHGDFSVVINNPNLVGNYVIPQGYHNGDGRVNVVWEDDLTVDATREKQKIQPGDGKILRNVYVNPIPEKYQDVSGVTAKEENVLAGSKFVDATGVLKDGTMPNNGTLALRFDPLTQSAVEVPEGYTSGGSVTMTDDLLNALKAI